VVIANSTAIEAYGGMFSFMRSFWLFGPLAWIAFAVARDFAGNG
jgi:hypothetical protein